VPEARRSHSSPLRVTDKNLERMVREIASHRAA
jgi:hypothetical protein